MFYLSVVNDSSLVKCNCSLVMERSLSLAAVRLLGLSDINILTVASKMSLQQIVVLVRVLFLACHGMCVWVLIACCSCWVG